MAFVLTVSVVVVIVLAVVGVLGVLIDGSAEPPGSNRDSGR
jgi:hypothetical protein